MLGLAYNKGIPSLTSTSFFQTTINYSSDVHAVSGQLSDSEVGVTIVKTIKWTNALDRYVKEY